MSLSVTIFAGCSPNNCIQGGARLSVSSHPVIDAAPKNPCGNLQNMRVVRKEPPCSAQESVLLCTREGTACADLDLLSFKIPAMCLCHCLAALHQRRPFHQFNLNAQSVHKQVTVEPDARLKLSPHAFKISLGEAARPSRLQRPHSMQTKAGGKQVWHDFLISANRSMRFLSDSRSRRHTQQSMYPQAWQRRLQQCCEHRLGTAWYGWMMVEAEGPTELLVSLLVHVGCVLGAGAVCHKGQRE